MKLNPVCKLKQLVYVAPQWLGHQPKLNTYHEGLLNINACYEKGSFVLSTVMVKKTWTLRMCVE